MGGEERASSLPTTAQSPRSMGTAEAPVAEGAAGSTNPGGKAEKPEKKDDTFRDEIVRQIFGDVGGINDDFSCAIQSKILLHGRMYLTDNFVCFYSNFFGFEKKIKIPIAHIRKVAKGTTPILAQSSLIISTSRKNYTFRSFWNRDECYFQLVNQIREIRGHEPETRERVTQSHSVDKQGKLDLPKAAVEKDGGAGASSDEDETASITSVGSSQLDDGDMLDFDGLLEGSRNVINEDMDVAFEKALAEKGLKEDGGSYHLNCSLEEFFDEFIADNAPCGLNRYHESQGDTVEEFGPWEEVDQGLGAARDLRFEVPLKDLPVGPSKAPLLKQQRLRVFGRVGMILETSHNMENVPSADCFTIVERWVIKPETSAPASSLESGDEQPHKVTLETSFEVKFNKFSMFKKIIESRSKQDEAAFFQKWHDMAQAHLASKSGGGEPKQQPTKGPEDANTSTATAGGPRYKSVPANASSPSDTPATAEKGPSRTTQLVETVKGAGAPVLERARQIKWPQLLLALAALLLLPLLLRSASNWLHHKPSTHAGLHGVGMAPQYSDNIAKELRGLRSDIQELTRALRDVCAERNPIRENGRV